MTVTQQDIELYGEDLIRDAQRWAMAEVTPRLNSLEYRLSQVSTETQRQRVIDALDADRELAGKWREINADAGFIAWLNQIDDFNGETRMRLLMRAFDGGFSERVANLFKAFIASRMPARQRTPHRLPLEGAPRVTVHAADVEGRRHVWTKAEIRNFYLAKAKGAFDGREAEALRIEQDLHDAINERRIAGDAMQMRMSSQRF